MCSDTSCAWRKTNRKAKPENWWEILTWFFNRNDKQQTLMICYTSSTCTSYHIQIDWFWFQIQLLQQLLTIYVDGIENRIWNCVYSPLVLLTEIQLYYCDWNSALLLWTTSNVNRCSCVNCPRATDHTCIR